MIVYFSSTGNGKYVATRIAEATQDRTVSLAQLVRDRQATLTIAPGEQLGFVRQPQPHDGGVLQPARG